MEIISSRQSLYASKPLSTANDSIRVITINPELTADGLISCSLKTIEFAHREDYEAMSYCWGDESIQKHIVVDGVEVQVRENLHDALHHMRKVSRGKPIWIDAISIFQDDIKEKNHQLRIMPHIYSRASAVLVWLGKLHVRQGTSITSDDAVRKAINNEYWSRVWILQEIGKARIIHVWFGDGQVVAWDDFIRSVRKLLQSETGPLALDSLRRNRYSGSCTLRSLLEGHATAACSDPRDKIYGLVGLAVDARGFPIDYRKSPFEVWVDTVHFMSRKSLLPEDPEKKAIFCKVLRALLGGDALEPVTGVLQFSNEYGRVCFNYAQDQHMRNIGLNNDPSNHSSRMNIDSETEELAMSSLELQCRVIGAVTSLGPTPSEMVSSLDLTDRWERELQHVYSVEYQNELDAAYKEHDSLMHQMLDTDDSKLPKLAFFNNFRVDFAGSEAFSWLRYDPNETDPAEQMSPFLRSSWNYTPVNQQEPRLALLRFTAMNMKTPYKIALVPPNTQLGDLICSYKGFPMKRMVIRHEYDQSDWPVKMSVCGTAMLVNDVIAQDEWEDVEVAAANSKMTDIRLDARTFYALLFGDSEN